MKTGYAYILANDKNGTIYIGVTSDITKRVYEHKNHLRDGFTKNYSVEKLVWFEQYEDITDAIVREKQLKQWRRDWKLDLVEQSNPNWNDLSKDF
ncbi:GIY-YIG nuclease family protein [Candidatus Saccharibacteria bacterium]|nr:GIY-YIG nuclease family protein [Candidatus Saccharibacteria bacterium]